MPGLIFVIMSMHRQLFAIFMYVKCILVCKTPLESLYVIYTRASDTNFVEVVGVYNDSTSIIVLTYFFHGPNSVFL